jgi:hypothetical protein
MSAIGDIVAKSAIADKKEKPVIGDMGRDF